LHHLLLSDNATPIGAGSTLMDDDGCWSVVDQEQVQAQMRGQRPPEGM